MLRRIIWYATQHDMAAGTFSSPVARVRSFQRFHSQLPLGIWQITQTITHFSLKLNMVSEKTCPAKPNFSLLRTTFTLFFAKALSLTVFFFILQKHLIECHQLLVFKLCKLSLGPNLFAWLEHFLTNLSQYVASIGHTSPFNLVDSGVPHGSVLGPLIFLIDMNDLPDLPKDVSSNIYLFASDCAILSEISDGSYHKYLQDDINAISNWCDIWLRQFKVTKCKTMCVTRSNLPPPNYYLNNVPLEAVTSYKYLGLLLTSTLSWSLHIDRVTSDTNRMLGYSRRNFSSAPTSLKLIVQNTYQK